MKKSVLLFALPLFTMLVGINTARAQQIIFQDGFEGGQFNPNFWTARPSLAGAAGGRVEIVNSSVNARTGSFSASDFYRSLPSPGSCCLSIGQVEGRCGETDRLPRRAAGKHRRV